MEQIRTNFFDCKRSNWIIGERSSVGRECSGRDWEAEGIWGLPAGYRHLYLVKNMKVVGNFKGDLQEREEILYK